MKIKLLPGAYMPESAHEDDAGFDLFAREAFDVPASKTEKGEVSGSFIAPSCVAVGSAVHDTGVCVEIPKGYVGLIKSKSGLNVKFGITSGHGVIDSGYTGSIRVKLYNHTDCAYRFNKGDKITQLVIVPILKPKLELADELDETERGDGGFGSTGR